jgi:precorrin-4/cobalt-precorrin-4 C11-methyltransferase
VTVHFIGAGPGAHDLLTLRAQRLIASCEVCLYAGSLVPRETLSEAPAGARLVDTRDLTLDEIVGHMSAADAAGEDVARLHSGDISLFSAAAEQMRRLDGLGIPWSITPGVPAYAAAAAALGRELTLPGVSQTVILARYGRRASAVPERERLSALAEHGATLVIHLGAHAIDEIAEALAEHYGPDCAVAVVARASRPDELVLRGTLATIGASCRGAAVRRTATIVVGPVLDADGFGDSHLYSHARARRAVSAHVRARGAR